MTASDNKIIPDFFNENQLDPVAVATGRATAQPAVPKKKAGFYFPTQLLDRYNRKFHQLKLDAIPVENKSMLAEMALHFALDDLDRGDAGRLLKRLKNA